MKVFLTMYFLLLAGLCSLVALIGSKGNDCSHLNCRRHLPSMYGSSISKNVNIPCHVEIHLLSLSIQLYKVSNFIWSYEIQPHSILQQVRAMFRGQQLILQDVRSTLSGIGCHCRSKHKNVHVCLCLQYT